MTKNELIVKNALSILAKLDRGNHELVTMIAVARAQGEIGQKIYELWKIFCEGCAEESELSKMLKSIMIDCGVDWEE